MAIVSSIITLNLLQGDGARIVHEQHTDNIGIVHELRYTPGPGVNVTTMLDAHASAIANQLVEAEINELLND